MLSCGTYDHIGRWIPPLIGTKTRIDEAVGIFDEALKRSIYRRKKE
jgi:4-aminobutyrate aminotransferase-like enzyme